MSLKRLTTEQMANISNAWLNPEELRPVFEDHDGLRLALPRIEAAHNGLFLYIKEEQVLPPAIVELIETARGTDVRHDSLIRGIYHTINGRIELARSQERKAALLGLRSVVLPAGLSITLKPYPEEAGAAELLENRLKPEEKALLQEIKVNEEGNGENLLVLVEEVITLGKELGVLDRKIKEAISEWEKTQGPPIGRADAQKARNTWIQMVYELESFFSMLQIPAEVVEKVMRPVREAEEVAERRYLQQQAREEEKKKAQAAASSKPPKKKEQKCEDEEPLPADGTGD